MSSSPRRARSMAIGCGRGGLLGLVRAAPASLAGTDEIDRRLADATGPVRVLIQTGGGIAPETCPNDVAGQGLRDAWAPFRVAETVLLDDVA